MVTSKVSPEVEKQLPSDDPPDIEPSDDLPTYEVAIKMPADYIKSPRDDDFVMETTRGDLHIANDFFTEDISSKNNCRQKFFITIIILCLIGFVLFFILLC